MIRQLTMTCSTPLQLSLLVIGAQAKLQGRPDLEHACEVAASKLPAVAVEYQLGAADFFAAACDQARQRGESAAVAVLESLIAEIKSGRHTTILGGFQVRAGSTPGEIEGQAEQLARRVIAARGG